MKAQIYNYSIWLEETNPAVLKETLTDALAAAGFNVLEITEHHFTPHGYTALWLLSESHLAVHTFPEHNSTYLELSSCIDKPFNSFITAINKTNDTH